MCRIPCIVCSNLYDGTTHCSVTACRACAMFLKRAQLWESNPACLYGKNRCNLKTLRDSHQILCPSCRYQKCIDAGMSPRENSRSLKLKCKAKNQSVMIKENRESLLLDQLMLVPEAMLTLKRYGYNYAVNTIAIKNYELKILNEDGEKLMDFPGNRKMGYMTISRSHRVRMCDASDMSIVHSSFPAFTAITDKQEDLMNMLNFLFFDLNSCFQTWRVFKDVNTTKMICSAAMFTDFDDMSNFLDSNITMHPMDEKILLNYFATCWQPSLCATLCLLDRIKLTDVEYLAVCCLLVWEEDNFICFPHLKGMADIHRYLIYKDLDHYYRNILRMDNYVERIMNIKELLKFLRKNLRTMCDGMHFLRTFNYYQCNEETCQAIVKVSELIVEN